jgi:hypothetical protein
VDPITITASLVAAKGAISACRSALQSAEDISAIGSHLDKIFHCSASAAKQKRKHEQALSHNQAVVAKRIGDSDADEQGAELSKIAQQRISELEHKEALEALGRDLDNRFGQGTWAGILASQKEAAARHRQRRKEARAAAEKKREESRAFWHKALVESAKGLGVCAIMGLVGLFLWWAANQGGR